MKVIKGRRHILDIIMWGVIQIYFFFPWIKLDGKRCTIHQYFLRGLQTKDYLQLYKDAFIANESLKYVTDNTGALADMFWIFTGILIGLQVLCFLYFIWRFFSERFRTPLLAVQLAIGSVGCTIIWLLGSDDSGMWDARRAGVKPPVSVVVNIYVGIYIGLMAMWLLAGVLEEQKSEIAAYQEKERAFKRERKKRLYFPGKYSNLYYRMLWKNLKFRKKDWILLDLAGVVATSALFVGLGIYQMFSGSYGENHGLLGPGLAEIMKDFLVIMTLIMLFMLTSVLIFYRRKRMTDTGLYRLLGIRSRSLRNAWIGELLICFVTSVVVGLLIGNICLHLLRMVLQRGVQSLGKLGNVGVSAYLGTILLMILISLFAFGFSHEVQSMKGSADLRGQAAGSERVPGRHRILITCLVAIPAIYAVIRYGQRRSAESIVVLSIFLLCMFGIMYQMGGVYLDDEKRYKNHYLKRLPFSHMISYRYQTTIRYLTLFVVIHVCVLFFFTMKLVSNQIATNVEELYPYDYVYLANSGDDEIFQELEEKCGAEIKKFPMVRATTMDNTERLERPGEIPAQQGQNIGISDFYLMDSLSVEENIMMPMILDKRKGKDCVKSARKYAKMLGIEKLLEKHPYELSGGEKQRVAICRALVNDPDLLLADEPTGNLDSRAGDVVLGILEEINQKMGKTILMVTHDPKMASHCSRLILLKDGKIKEDIQRTKNVEAFYQEILGKMKEL